MNNVIKERADRILKNSKNLNLAQAAQEFMAESLIPQYSYNFEWLGRPIIQYPQDMAAMQEIIWQVRPDLIIETGIAHGGSLIFSASMLALLDVCDAIEQKESIDPSKSARKVLAIDIDIRAHNRAAINAHPMASRIQMIEGSSIDPSVVSEVSTAAQAKSRVLLCLDSNHTEEHVLAELEAYASFTSVGSYCVVFDTLIERLPHDSSPHRPWGPGNSPMSAVRRFLESHPEFASDTEIDRRLRISVAPEGYLRRLR